MTVEPTTAETERTEPTTAKPVTTEPTEPERTDPPTTEPERTVEPVRNQPTTRPIVVDPEATVAITDNNNLPIPEVQDAGEQPADSSNRTGLLGSGAVWDCSINCF